MSFMNALFLRYMYKCKGVDLPTMFRILDRPTLITPPPRARWHNAKISAFMALILVEDFLIFFGLWHYADLHTGNHDSWMRIHIKDPHRSTPTGEETMRSRELNKELVRLEEWLKSDNERMKKILGIN